MNTDMLKVNILAIAISGFIMMISGGAIYFCRGWLTNGSIRYFLPIPPIAVAAYIFVFNMFKYQSSTSSGQLNLIVEIVLATLTSSLFFLFFTIVLVLLIMNFK